MITYTYKISDFIDSEKMLANYAANTALNQGAENALEDIGLDEKDDGILKKFLKIACALIANTLSGYAKNLLDTDGVTTLEDFEFDVTYNTVENSIVFRVNMPTTWPESAMPLIDKQIIDALENYVLYRVGMMRKTEFESYHALFELARDEVRSLLSRRTEPVSRKKQFF